MQRKKKEYDLIISAKRIALNFNKYLENVPNKEKILRDNVNKLCFDMIENIYIANNLNKELFKEKRIYHETIALSKINLLDYCLEIMYLNKYIGEKKSMNMGKELLNIRNRVKGWIISETGNH